MKGHNGLYLMGNYPDPDTFIEAAVRGLDFFDFLEVGIPFSDPSADGPVITDAAEAVLARNTTFDDVLSSVRRIRERALDGKIIYAMAYANTVFARGIGNFAEKASGAGFNGVIIPDVPFAESERFIKAFARHGMSFVRFISPETTIGQIGMIGPGAEGFLYFVSMRGITGGRFDLDAATVKKIRAARKCSPVPVVLGFGIADIQSARRALDHADGFVIGTRIIEILKDGGLDAAGEFFSAIAGGVGRA